MSRMATSMWLASGSGTAMPSSSRMYWKKSRCRGPLIRSNMSFFWSLFPIPRAVIPCLSENRDRQAETSGRRPHGAGPARRGAVSSSAAAGQCAGPLSNRNAKLRFFDDVVDDVPEILPLLIDRQLTIGAGTTFDDLTDVVDVLTRAEVIDDVVDELEQFVEEHRRRHFLLLS